jgi:hypothetical protein
MLERTRNAIDEEKARQLARYGARNDADHSAAEWVALIIVRLGMALRAFPGDRTIFRKHVLEAATLCVAFLEAIDDGNAHDSFSRKDS